MVEAPYAFRRYLETVHRPDRRSPEARAEDGEFTIDSSWTIVVRRDAHQLVLNVARDLQEYFLVSMEESLPLSVVDEHATDGIRQIVIATAAHYSTLAEIPATPRGYRLVASADRILLVGTDPRGAAQASYFFEDLLNLRQGPFISSRSESREPVFSPRMTHSGWGLDEFPDAYLNQIAHAGMDAILVFTSDANRTPDESINRHPERHSQGRYQDFNAIVDRCEKYGLDVYLYAYFHGKRSVHPEDPGAERFYDEAYGSAFKACPRAKGIILVGESVEFPSHDPKTTGRMRLEPIPGGLPVDKPSPGWWPCEDYPAWVSMVRDSCRKYKSDAEIIFWTYNWGYAPEEDRLRLIRSLPTDINLHVTFEMFEPIHHDGVTNVCVDYTAASIGPGTYFASEAAVAHERGITLSTMCNTGGLTWDYGDIPYQPIPHQWNKRHHALLKAHADWNLTGLMESHHFGWWPSVASEVAKWNYWLPAVDFDEVINAIARRDFGDGADFAVRAWEEWSRATEDYIPTNEDQYGPFRIGPSYPVTLFANPKLQVADHAMFGDMIVNTPYTPENGARRAKTAAAIRINAEITSLGRMLERWKHGCELLSQAIALAPDHRKSEGERMLNLGRYIAHSTQTVINVKKWWKLKSRVIVEDNPDAAEKLLDGMIELGSAELENCRATIPIVERDSRLGWEPTMDYLGDAEHIQWKISHLKHTLEKEIPAYRASLRV